MLNSIRICTGLEAQNFARSRNEIELVGVARTSVTRTNAFDFSVGIRYYFGGVRSL